MSNNNNKNTTNNPQVMDVEFYRDYLRTLANHLQDISSDLKASTQKASIAVDEAAQGNYYVVRVLNSTPVKNSLEVSSVFINMSNDYI